MTVCIASICHQGNCIVSVSDKMISMPEMSADSIASKFSAIGNKWITMFAGNDISPVTPILKNVRSVVNPVPDETLEIVARAFQEAFRREIVKKAEATILARFDLTMQEFREHGLANFGSELFTRLVYEIEQINLDLTFLVFGFDKSDPTLDAGNIFTVQNRGEISHFDVSGFWAIGSGQTSALGTLFGARRTVPFCRLSDVLYLLAKAKFNSESALGVGKETIAIVLQQDGKRYVIHNDEMTKLKDIWTNERPVDVSAQARQVADTVLEAGKQPKRSASPT